MYCIIAEYATAESRFCARAAHGRDAEATDLARSARSSKQ